MEWASQFGFYISFPQNPKWVDDIRENRWVVSLGTRRTHPSCWQLTLTRPALLFSVKEATGIRDPPPQHNGCSSGWSFKRNTPWKRFQEPKSVYILKEQQSKRCPNSQLPRCEIVEARGSKIDWVFLAQNVPNTVDDKTPTNWSGTASRLCCWCIVSHPTSTTTHDRS